MMEASPAGGFAEIPCYPCLCNSPSDFTQTQTLVWHHSHLLHNQDVFSCKLFISLSKQVLASIPWGKKKKAHRRACVVIIITKCQLGDPHHQDEEMGA